MSNHTHSSPPRRISIDKQSPDPANATTQASAYEAARQVLSEDQISAAIWLAVTINAFNRVSIMSKHPVPPRPDK
ncbi:hypothetical protein ABZ922_39705 [Streptomyces shenzhenensis]|uniref:hypothetical protein n=1 Tax=Streptomyces shenzhenensis TaxID=943815 RepID=UPI003410D02B